MIIRSIILLHLIALVLTACVTGNEKNPTQNNLNATSHSDYRCSEGITVKVNGQPILVTVPNPFHGFPNPGLRIQEGRFIIELNTKESGFFELLDFDSNNLRPGTFRGDQFRLTLSYSPYTTNTVCTHTDYQQESIFVIEKYTPTDKQLVGCLFGQLDCGGQVVEINANVSGTLL